MGLHASKPVAPSGPINEKASYNVAESRPSTAVVTASASSGRTLHHHAVDRLARIQAESLTHRSTAAVQASGSASLSLASIAAWQDEALATSTAKLAQLTLYNAALPTSLHKRDVEVSSQHIFSHTIPYEVKPVVNQKSSGRCWLFATCNVIRHQTAKVLNLDEFELSQSYLSFWDKLEKSNYFLENMIELADEALNDRVVDFLKTAPTKDGGQWDMVANLLAKYGVVPKAVFPESFHSSNSSQLNWLVTVKLREYTLELRAIKQNVLRRLQKAGMSEVEQKAAVVAAQRARKENQMAEVYRILVICLGTPPAPDAQFTYNYRDKAGKFATIRATPRSFLRDYTGSFDSAARCSLIHDPRHPPARLITVERLGNVWGATPISYVNTTVDIMRAAVVASITAGHPVFFGCDSGQFLDKTSGIMDQALFGYDVAFNIKLGLSKVERIQLGESAMTHAMVITAVHIEDGIIQRYRVENSWGSDGVGNNGYMVMSDAWFAEFTYQIVVRKQFVPKHLWALFANGVDANTIRLPPYDPLGALA